MAHIPPCDLASGSLGTTPFYFLLGTEAVDETFASQLHVDSGSGGSYAQAMDWRITS